MQIHNEHLIKKYEVCSMSQKQKTNVSSEVESLSAMTLHFGNLLCEAHLKLIHFSSAVKPN